MYTSSILGLFLERGRRLSRSRRTRCKVGYYILGIAPSVSLRRGSIVAQVKSKLTKPM